MRLQEVFDILKNTELKQIVEGEDNDKIISLLNLALIEVYAKFSILQEEQIITIEEGKTRYRLQDNSQKILQVMYRNTSNNPLLGYDQFIEIPVNDLNDPESVFTPQPYVLHIPNPNKGRIYSIIQVVTPPYITKENLSTLDFLIPPQYLEPILHYAAYRAYKSMNGSEQTEIGSHWRAYMMSCVEVYKQGLVQNGVYTNVKLNDRGYY